jgi:predicted permease
MDQMTVSPPDFTDVRAQNHSFSAMAAASGGGATLTGSGDPVSLDGLRVTADYFRVLGTRAALGRTFDSTEFEKGTDHVVILSNGTWKKQFGGDPAIIGRSMVLNAESYTVIGVLAAGESFPERMDYWAPLSFSAEELSTQRGAHWLFVTGRLRDGVTPEQARTDVGAIGARLAAAYPKTNTNGGVAIENLRETLTGDLRVMLLVLLGAVTLVLMIACANVANLLLARASGRTRDVAVSMALGARRGDLIRRSLAESLLLTGAGAVVGLLLASWLTSALAALRPDALRNVKDIAIDAPVLVYTLLVACGTGVLFGLFPVWRAGRAADVHQLLRSGGRGVVGAGASWRVRGGLVAAELAIGVMLLAGAGLLVRSFARLQQVDPGFVTAQAWTFGVSLPDARYPKPENARQFFGALEERLAAIPGVAGVAGTNILPLDENNYSISVRSIDGVLIPDEKQPSVQIRVVTPDFLKGLKVQFVAGRDFTAADRDSTPIVTVVNEAAARLLWHGENAMGRHFELGTKLSLGGPRAGGEVIGVVRDIHDDAISRPPSPTAYVSHLQFPVGDMSMVIRAQPGTDARTLAAPVRAAMKATDPDLPQSALKPLAELVNGSIARPRFSMLVVGLFATIALALASVGIYGVMAGLVNQRESEIGIRMALGAGGARVVSEIVRTMVPAVGVGLAAGLLGALALTRLLGSLLYEIRPSDPITLAGTMAALVVVAFLSSYLPARRASRVDPMTALRAE